MLLAGGQASKFLEVTLTQKSERQQRYKALIYGAQLGCITATAVQAIVVGIMGLAEIFRGNVMAGLFVPVLYFFYGLLIGGVFVNLFLWLILLPVYGRSRLRLSKTSAVLWGMLLGPLYMLLLVFVFLPGQFGRDAASVFVVCAVGALYGVCVAYWCTRLEQRFLLQCEPIVAKAVENSRIA